MGRGKRQEQASLFPFPFPSCPARFLFSCPSPSLRQKEASVEEGREELRREFFDKLGTVKNKSFETSSTPIRISWKQRFFFSPFSKKYESTKRIRIVFAHSSFSSPEPLRSICNEPLVSRPRDQETTGSGDESRDFKQWRRRRWRKCLFKTEITLFQNSSLLFHGVHFVKCWRIFLQLNSKGLDLSLKKELEKSLSCVNVLQKTRN